MHTLYAVQPRYRRYPATHFRKVNHGTCKRAVHVCSAVAAAR